MPNRVKRLSNPEISAFCTQMSMLLQSGIPAADGIDILGADAADREKELYTALSLHLKEGLTLGQSMRAAGFFPEYACDMTHIGELSGRTDTVLEALSLHYEREEETARAIRSAVTYPAIMIVMLLAVIFVLITKVLPIFDQVYQQLGSELTGFSRQLMNFGSLTGRHFAAVLIVPAVPAFLAIALFKTESGRRIRQRLILRIPPLRRLQEQLSAGRFADGLSISLSSGLTVEESLELAATLADDPLSAQKIKHCREVYQSSASLLEAIQSAQLFSGLYARMLATGFAAGATEDVLHKIAKQYAQKSEESISRIVSILEPTSVAVLSCLVGFVLLSVMLPLLGILSGIGL